MSKLTRTLIIGATLAVLAATRTRRRARLGHAA